MLSLYDVPELYDLMFPPGPAEAFYRGVAGEVAVPVGGAVLELACGSGRLTLPLARDGHAVVGLDQSEAMLTAARDKARAAGVGVELIAGDMRDFALGRAFSLVMVAQNSLLHLLTTDDLVRCLRRVREHLAPGGRFAFDVFVPSPRLLAREAGKRYEIGRYLHPTRGELLLEETVEWNMAAQVNRATWYVSTAAARDVFVVPLHLRAIFPQELPLLLAAAGLTLESRFGDFAGGPFIADSRHQVCICRAE
jgi:SAM-dependent methyltransferase